MFGNNALVVEDEPAIAEFMASWLRSAIWNVNTAGTVKTAKEIIAKDAQNLDLIIIDLNLPDGTGFEVIHEARRHEGWIDIVIVTGYGSLVDTEEALRLSVLDFMRKPITEEEFRGMLNRIQSKRKLRLGVFAKNLIRIDKLYTEILNRVDHIDDRLSHLEGNLRAT
jgi:two-component system, response regulator YesN